jgi:anti-sigma regulatory factor (Ser/Thr protein kinase)
MPARKYTLNLRQEMSDLNKLHDFLQRVCESLCISKKCLLETTLVLEEIFSNVVNHGLNKNRDCSFRVTIMADEGGLNIRVEDTGEAFNPLDRKKPAMPNDIDNCTEGGLGIHLIKHFVDGIRYQRDLRRNVLTMRKDNCMRKAIYEASSLL